MSETVLTNGAGFRLAHTMLRVNDLDAALDFYIGKLGMRELQRRDHKKNQFTQVYVGYGDGFDQMVLELVFNWMQDEPYEAGQAFGHIAIEVKGIFGLCNRLKAAGIPLPREPRSQKHGNTVIAFIEDPDGHRIELFEPAPAEIAAQSAETTAA